MLTKHQYVLISRCLSARHTVFNHWCKSPYKYQGKDKFLFCMISGHRAWLPCEVFSQTANTARVSVPVHHKYSVHCWVI